jgi:hypothetical protein
MSNWLRRAWLLIPVLLLTLAVANAQQLTGTLSGIVTDPKDARIPGAKVVVKNDATGDIRQTKADGSGFWSVTALIPGTYTVDISAQGFANWEENGILLNQGDSRNVANIHMAIASSTTAVTVISGADAEVPVDNAEISDTLNNELVDSAILTGRNAAELIKMMPGVVFNNGGGVGSGYNSQVTGTNNGPAGSFSANGTQPYGSTVVMLDGANLLDPGNAGTQVANINQDMTDSVKYLSASYGAEYAKGPAVLQAFSKSGGQKYHGEAYLYARNTAIGYANDWYAKNQQISQGQPNSLTEQYFYYIGGNVGGPVSFLGFNRNKDKLFFWGGYEKMIQHPYNSPVEMNVPTAAQSSGDFTNPGVASQVFQVYPAAYATPCNTDDGWQGCGKSTSPWAPYNNGGNMPNLSNYFDKEGKIINGLNPPANQTPNAGNGWNNYAFTPITPQDRWEGTGKLTYAFNDNNKLWGSYAYQSENDLHPLSVWWAPEWTIPYPGGVTGKETANLYLANFTHVFSATSTNEFVFAYAKFVNDNSLSNPAAMSRSKLGFPTQSFYGGKPTDQMPNTSGPWAGGLTEINEFDFNSGIYGPNSFGKTSKSPSITDTFTKIVSTHSLKGGFYWDEESNLQSNGNDVQGNYDFESWSAVSTYNVTLDRLMGRVYNYDETNLDAVPNILWHQWSLWAQDSWKATRKLTVNYGLRADHIGQWYTNLGGMQVWIPSQYDNGPNPAPNTGLAWHKTNPSVPLSGFKSPLFYYDPRVGVAYDVFGTGKTVVRSGFGTYRYQISGNDASGATNGPLGSFDFGTANTGMNGFYGYGINGGTVCTAITGGANPSGTTGGGTCNPGATTTVALPTGVNLNHGSGFRVDQLNDTRVPYANTYSFGVAQALPSHTVAEVSYVGSMSRNQFINGSNGHIDDLNGVAYGAFFTPDPLNGRYENIAPINDNNGPNTNDWRPLQNYSGSIFLQTHGGYANYNSLQVSAQKQSGNLYLFTNFTFGKVLGTRDGNTNNGNGNGTMVNPYNLDSNYGPLGYDHTKVFNFSASYKLPSPVHNSWALGELVNGWQLTNYTTYQDGSPYQAGSVNMNMNYQQYHCVSNGDPNCPAGSKAGDTINSPITMPIPATATDSKGVVVGNQTYSIGSNSWFGSSQFPQGIQPLLLCDPRKGTGKGQYFNPNCMAAPLPPTATSFGQEGPIIWPYIRNPHYFDSDMAIFKAFRITDTQRIEARISATNWLNHPNALFGLAGVADNQLLFNGLSTPSKLTMNSNTSTTGIPQNKLGYRWMQFAAKYYF